jgi:hypothetical protein
MTRTIRNSRCWRGIVNGARILGIGLPLYVADQLAHLFNQGGQFAIDLYETINPTGYNTPIAVVVLVFSFFCCIIEMALEYFHPVRRDCRIHQDQMRLLEEPPVNTIHPPLPAAQANARLASVAAWLPDIPDISAVSLPRTPSPAHLRDEEMELENIERRGSAGTTAPLPVDDENVDAIELEEFDEEEQGES